MDTPTVQLKPINSAIYDLMMTACFSIVDETPEAIEYYAQHNAAMEKLKDTMPTDEWIKLCDRLMNCATHYGAEMFRRGMALGRNPGAIFDLPNVVN